MIRLFYIFPVLLGFLHNGYGQNSPQSKSVPPLPGFSSFHSNLGIQEIIEVGVPLQKEVPAPAPTNLSPPVQKQAEPAVARPVESAPSAPAAQAAQPASVVRSTPTQSRVGETRQLSEHFQPTRRACLFHLQCSSSGQFSC